MVGDSRCPIADTWWQTETGGIMIAPLPLEGWEQKPGSASFPFFGVQPVLITPEGKEIEGAAEGDRHGVSIGLEGRGGAGQCRSRRTRSEGLCVVLLS